MTPPTVLVLAGGGSRRFGSDKLAARLGEETVLDTLLVSLPDGWPVIAVGPTRPTRTAVVWTVEEPAGGGPLAAIASGAGQTHTSLLAVIAGDQPFAGPVLPQLLNALTDNVDAVVARDATGRENPLLAIYRTDALRRALPESPAGRPARTLLDALTHTSVEVSDRAALDVDTPDRLTLARRRLAE